MLSPSSRTQAKFLTLKNYVLETRLRSFEMISQNIWFRLRTDQMASSTPARAPCWGVPLLVAGRTGGWIDRPICATNLSFRRVPIAHLARSSYARRAPRVQHAVPQLPLELQAEESTKQQKEWKFSSWISTKRDIRAAVEECASKIKPKFGAAKVLFFFTIFL